MSTAEILDRVTESTGAIVVFSIFGLVALWLLYRLVRHFADAHGRFGEAVLDFMRGFAKEISGGRTGRPYERQNFFLILALAALSLGYLVFFVILSVRSILTASDAPAGALAAFLICLIVTAGAGLLCVRACASHDRDRQRLERMSRRRF